MVADVHITVTPHTGAQLIVAKGWTPILAVANDGQRRVHRVIGWVGGTGDEPPTGLFVGTTGLVDTIADGVDVRGAAGQDASPDFGLITNNMASGTGDRPIFTAPAAILVRAIRLIFTAASASATLDVRKNTGSQAPTAGVSMLAAPMSTSGATNTVINGSLSGTVANLTLADGDRIATTHSGTTTGLNNCVLTVSFEWL